MSLKGFHIVFMIAATLLSSGLAVRGFAAFAESRDAMELVTGLCAMAFAAALLVYAVRFLRRSKGVSWL